MNYVRELQEVAFRLRAGSFLPNLQNLFKPPADGSPNKNTVKRPTRWYLIKAYGLEDLAELISQFNFNSALEWQRIRGTKSSIIIALKMIGVDVERIEEGKGKRWNFYKVRLKKIPESVNYETIIALCKLSAPLRSRLYRLADVTKEVPSFKLSSKNGKLGTNLISNYSGGKIVGIWVS